MRVGCESPHKRYSARYSQSGGMSAEPIAEQLQREMDCEDVLEQFYGLKRLDRECFRLLADAEEPLTVDGVADAVDRERSTAYRSIQRLLRSGVVRKEQVDYDRGGYCHVYSPADASTVGDDLRRHLNDWYAEMGQLIDEFERTYEAGESVRVED